MTREEVLDFVSKNRIGFVATVDGDTPQVRGLMVVKADERGILFNVGTGKDVHKQLMANPKVEVAFVAQDGSCQVRVSGTMEARNDQQTKDEVLEVFTFLKPFVEQFGYDALSPYLLAHGRSTVWTMAGIRDPKVYTDF